MCKRHVILLNTHCKCGVNKIAYFQYWLVWVGLYVVAHRGRSHQDRGREIVKVEP